MRRASVGEVAPQTWTKLSASGNEFVYTNGPLSCAFRCRDTVTGHEHDFVLDRGARFTMPPGGKFDLVECFHWDPVACSVEIALGAGRIEYPTGSRIPNGPDLRGNYAHHLQAGGAGTYAVQAFLNPSDSGIIAEISMFRGIYAGALGIAYNSDILSEKNIAPSECWADLEDPRFVGEIQVANPNSSGTAYTGLATFVQLFGEDEAMTKLAAVGQNVNSYTKSGSAPSKAAARGETGVSIGFMHDMVTLASQGFPLQIVAPCEGTGYEVGAVSIIEGARNFEGAQKWVEFALRADIQSRAPEVGSFQVPSNSNAEVAPESPDLASIKLIDYDFATYGSSETRERLLARWDAEVGDPNSQQ